MSAFAPPAAHHRPFAAPTPATAAAEDVADAATLAELNGMLVHAADEARALELRASVGGGALPALDAAGGLRHGFGFRPPPEIVEAAARRAQSAPPPPPPPPPGLASWLGFGGRVSAPAPAAPPADAQICAFAWQGEPELLPAGGVDASAWRHACAVGLYDHTVALYDLNLGAWAPELLASEHQHGVRALAWQPHARSLLAVGCAGGVCLWQLQLASSAAAFRKRLVRVVALPQAAPAAAPSCALAWHPAGHWLAAGGGGARAVVVADGAGERRDELWMAGGPLGGGGGGVGVVSLSRDGALLLAAGAAGGVRVWDTRDWRWESWPSLGAPCVAAAWAGSAHGEAEAARTLLVALAGEARLCAYRFPRRHHTGAQQLRPEAIGQIDLCTLPPPPPPLAAAGGAATASVAGLAWEAGGARVVVALRAADGSSALCVLGARAFPSLQVHCVGWLRTPAGDDAGLAALSGADARGGATLLTAAWADGRVTLVPLHA